MPVDVGVSFMPKQYDAIIVGTGTAGASIARKLRAAGWQVAICDQRRFGGTCALRGCDPKKVLVQAASAVDHARRSQGKGVSGGISLDWSALMDFKRRFTEPVPARTERSFADHGIDAYHGAGRFTGKDTLMIAEMTLQARYIVLAVGAEPVSLGIAGKEYLATSEQVLALDRLPQRVALVGGGYIAAEFASTLARAGTQAIVLQHGPTMLKQFDPDMVALLMQSFERHNIAVHTCTSVMSIEKDGTGYVVHGRKQERAKEEAIAIKVDLVVHAAGRKPALEEMDLGKADIAVDGDGKLHLNEFLQSVSNPCIYAAGDAAQMGPPLTPVASHDAGVVAANLLKGNHARPNYAGVPSVAFTIPPIASVGITESQAKAKGMKIKVNSANASDWFTARQVNESTYGFKVLVAEDTGKILGAHLVGPHVDDVINLFAMAIRHGLSAEDLKNTIFAYPTGASDIGEML
jgi:glutathione reductase (NADPH)